MKEVTTPAFWQQRMAESPDARRIIWDGTDQQWDQMEKRHRELLERTVQPSWSVLDAGCGYGRLLGMMPKLWHGFYVGLDVSPDLIQMARNHWPGKSFSVCDLTQPLPLWAPKFDIAVCVMLRHMLRTHAGEEVWQKVKANILQRADRMLCLEPEGFDGDC